MSMRKVLLLLSTTCLLLLYTVDGQGKSQQGRGHGNIISKSNWGVFFTKERTILNGESYFRHTIVYDMLPFNTALPDIVKILPCDREDYTSMPRQFKCQEINELVENVNKLIRDEVNMIIKDVQDALQIIPEGIKNIDLVNNNVKAAGDGSGGVKRKKRDVKINRDSINVLFPNDTLWEYVSGSDPNKAKKRSRRSVFTTAGNFMSDLFGWPSQQDVDALETHIGELTKVGSKLKDQLMDSTTSLTCFQIKSKYALATAMTGLKENGKNIDKLRGNIVKMQKQHLRLKDKELEEMAIMNKNVDAYGKFLMGVSAYQNSIETLRYNSIMFIDAIKDLSRGFISPFILPPKDVKVITAQAKTALKKYGGTFELSNSGDNPGFYYQMQNLIYTRNQNNIVLMMKVPFHNTGGVLNVYRMHSFPIYRTSESLETTQITYLSTYFAVDENGVHFSEFDESYFDSCRGTNVKSCNSQVSLQRVNDDNNPSCALALYKGDSVNIMKNCKIAYKKHKVPPPHKPYMLPNGTYFIVGGDPKSNERWHINCPGATDGYNSRSIPACTLCMIDVPCFCRLGSKDFNIPIRLTGCVRDDPNHPYVVYRNLINLPSVNTHFAEQVAKQFRSDVARIGSKWKAETYFKPVEIDESKIDDILEIQGKNLKDFKKISRLQKQRSIMYGSEAAKLFKKSEDMSDFVNAHTKAWDSQNDYANKTILGYMLTVGFSVGAILLSCFVLIKKKV